MDLSFLNGFGGQVLLGALGLVVAGIAYLIGKKFGVTPQQVKEFLEVYKQKNISLDEREIAKFVQRNIRKSIFKKIKE